MVPASFPNSLLIVGSGAIGIEFASFYRSLGAEVTVVEMLPRILPAEDEEISELARKAFARQGIAIHTGTRVERLAKGADSVTATLRLRRRRCQGASPPSASSSPSASPAMSKGLGSNSRGCEIENGHIVVDEWCRTGAPGPLRHRRRGRTALARA